MIKDGSMHLTFYHYLVDDENAEEYDKSLPYGGVKKDTPQKHKKEYEKFVEEYKKCEQKLISEGYTLDDAEQEVKKYYDFIKNSVTKKCNNAWKKHLEKRKKQ